MLDLPAPIWKKTGRISLITFLLVVSGVIIFGCNFGIHIKIDLSAHFLNGYF
jgi:hypothetical protein